jgi:hypothetical protein
MYALLSSGPSPGPQTGRLVSAHYAKRKLTICFLFFPFGPFRA